MNTILPSAKRVGNDAGQAPSTYTVWRVAGAYALAHFFVDFCSAALIFGALRNAGDWRLTLLLYNFCAFALQMPMGLLADRYKKSLPCVQISCLLLAMACLLGTAPGERLASFVAALAGLGNGMFHIGAGIEVLHESGKSAGPLGIFVAPGALGIFLGTALGRQGGYPPPVVGLLLASVAAVLFLAWLANRRPQADRIPFSLAAPRGVPALFCLTCLFLVVCLRSYMGMALPFAWKGEGAYPAVLVLASALGKAAGGMLADRLGAARASVCSLLIAAVLLLFPAYPPVGVVAVLLINMTMPVTLWALARVFPGAKGFSFGLLTFALFLGFVPIILGMSGPPFVVFPAAVAASAVILFVGLRRTP